MRRYNNYHKHTTYSSALVPDTHIDMEGYFKRAKELGHTNYYTVEHGYGGSIFKAKELGEKYGINVCFGMEIYIVEDNLKRDKRGYHCIVLAKTDKARKKINKLNSMAHRDGVYYNARWSLEYILSLDKEDVYITTACISGLLKDEDSISKLFIPIMNKFKESFFIEVHNFNHESQIEHNILALQLSEVHGVKLIHANDSHYIYPHQHQDRIGYLKGKGISYEDEDSFILDYPSYEEIEKRYKTQGLFSEKVIKEAIENTLLFDNLEEVDINRSIKMPTIYPNKTIKEKHDILSSIIKENFKKIQIEDNIPSCKIEEYKKGINEEFKTITDTSEVKSVDYFLLNEKIINLAKDKYGGLLTKTGRGSNTAFYINRLLGFTEIDRFNMSLPLYPERFMSTTRLLENNSMPDNDYNTVDAKPFIDASREVLGDDNCYYMIAYGTMQEGEAFRNTCRNKGMVFSEFNDVAKNLDDYREDVFWKPIIEESVKYINSIVNKSPSPCACLIMTENISEEVGLIRVKDEMVAVINSNEAEDWKYLKNDYLQVAVWDIIYKSMDLIGIDISLNELIELTKDDEKTWDMYKLGLTATLNQADSDWATGLVKRYSPKSYREFAMWTSCIRPNFESFREDFLNRKEYTHQVRELDEIYKSTDKWILFQENLMQFFTWLGVPADHTVGLIKKIGKKKISEEDFSKLENDLRKNWIKNVGNEDMFDETWDKMQSMLGYGYNTPHALSVTFDSLYGAYLKSHYPIEYYTIILNEYQNDTEKTNKITKELKHFKLTLRPVEFGKSNSQYSFDKVGNIIYKGLKSVKYINDKIPSELNELYKNNLTFPELIKAIKNETSVNSRQLEVLIKINYFKEYGSINNLLKFIDWTNRLSNKTYKIESIESDIEKYLTFGVKTDVIKDSKKIKKELWNGIGSIIDETKKGYTVEYDKEVTVYPFCEKANTTYKNLDKDMIFNLIWDDLDEDDIDLLEKLRYEMEYLGYISEIPNGISVATVEMVSVKYRSGNLKSMRNGLTKWFKFKKDESTVPKKGDIILIKDTYSKKGYNGRIDHYVKKYEKL